VFDAIGSIAVGVLLIVVAVMLAIEIKALITGQSADPHVESALGEFVRRQPEVAELYNLLTLQLGDEIMVAIKARMAEVTDVTRLVDDVNHVEVGLRQAFPQVRWIFFEPDTKA